MIDTEDFSRHLEAILDHLPLLVFLKDTENRFLFVNDYGARAYRKPKAELVGVDLYDLYDRKTAEKFHDDDRAVIESGIPKFDIEEAWETETGTRWMTTSKLPFRDREGATVGVIGISIDVTERKRKEQLIEALIRRLEGERNAAVNASMVDGLTGLRNRRFFDQSYPTELARARRAATPISILLVDVDFFKKYNDAYGHLRGDDCLRRVSSALKASLLRPGDSASRYGGEEFAIILPDTDERGAEKVAERLQANVERLGIEHETSETGRFLTVSIGGITVVDGAVRDADLVLGQVDRELYKAKAEGRNRHCLGTAGLESAGDANPVA